MSGTISINHDVAAETGRQLLAERESMQESFDSLRTANDGLSSVWAGSASSAFVQTVGQVVVEGDALAAELSVFGEKITQANLTFEENEMLIAAWMTGGI